MKYGISFGVTMGELVERVNHMIQLGWHPHGGIAVSVAQGVENFYQAMVDSRPEEEAK